MVLVPVLVAAVVAVVVVGAWVVAHAVFSPVRAAVEVEPVGWSDGIVPHNWQQVAALEPPVCPTDIPAGSSCVWVLNPESPQPQPTFTVTVVQTTVAPGPVDTSAADAVTQLRATIVAGFALVLLLLAAMLVGWWRRRD